MHVEDYREKILELRTDMEALYDDIDAWEPNPDDFDSMYRDMLDEVYGTVSIAGMEYDTSTVLKEIDPTAYRTGRNDFVDSLEDVLNRYRYEEFDTEYGEISDRYSAIMEPYFHSDDFPTEYGELEDEFDELEMLMGSINMLLI